MSNARPLVELEPEWIMPGSNPCAKRQLGPAEAMASGERPVGVFFWCPACPKTHGIGIPFQSCPPNQNWLGGADAPRWEASVPADLDPGKLTVSPSIDCTGQSGCGFHGWIRDGMVTW